LKFEIRDLKPDPPHSPSAAIAPAASPPLHCSHCDYNLHGLPPTGNCPECGLPIARSAGRTRLRDAPPAWLASLSWGARLALVAAAVCVGFPFLPGVLFTIRPARGFPTVAQLLLPAATLLYAIAAWLLTRPQSPFAPRAAPARIAARAAAMLPLLAELSGFVAHRPAPLQWLIAHSFFAWLLTAALMLLHLRRLALRLPQPALARCCAAGAAAFAAAALVGFVDDALDLTPAAGLEMVFIGFVVLGAVAYGAALLWCVIAFGHAHRASRQATL
jgi:hypothetical protein